MTWKSCGNRLEPNQQRNLFISPGLAHPFLQFNFLGPFPHSVPWIGTRPWWSLRIWYIWMWTGWDQDSGWMVNCYSLALSVSDVHFLILAGWWSPTGSGCSRTIHIKIMLRWSQHSFSVNWSETLYLLLASLIILRPYPGQRALILWRNGIPLTIFCPSDISSFLCTSMKSKSLPLRPHMSHAQLTWHSHWVLTIVIIPPPSDETQEDHMWAWHISITPLCVYHTIYHLAI